MAGEVEYVAASRRHVIPMDTVTSVEFVRDEAIFPDLYGPYLETSWWIETSADERVEIMDEWPDRARLLRAFRQHLAGFDTAVAKEAIRSKGKGRWRCFERQPDARITTLAPDSAPR